MSQEFIYILRPTRPEMLSKGPTSHESEVVGRHFQYLKGLCDDGIVLTAGRTLTDDERTLGLVIFRAANQEAADSLVAADPAVLEGVMSAEVIPFRVALLSDCWAIVE